MVIILILKLKILLKKLFSKLYKEDKRLFFSVGSGDVNSPKGIVKYLGRYLARAPIAEYKITYYDNEKVTFFFNDLANDKNSLLWFLIFYHKRLYFLTIYRLFSTLSIVLFLES